MTDTSNTTPITVTDEQFQNTFQMLGSFSKSIKELSDQLRTLQKTFKSADKQSKINKKKPQEAMKLSTSLAKFLSVDSNTMLTKAQVMKSISEYIKTNNLQVQTNKRKFKPNTTLTKVFGMPKNSELTFVEINKHVSSHLSK